METNTEATKKAGSFPVKEVGLGIAIILLDVVAIYFMIKHGNDHVELLGYDTIKLSIQLLLVVLVGGILIQKYNRSRESKVAANDFRRGTLRNLSRAYSDIKGVRRILRAKCQPDSGAQSAPVEDCLPIAAYDEHIAIINATQLELEILGRELKIIKKVFVKTQDLIEHIGSMEKYIKGVVSEYETKSKAYRSSGSVPMSKLPRLTALIAKSHESTEFKTFVDSYDKALTLIQGERIKVT